MGKLGPGAEGDRAPMPLRAWSGPGLALFLLAGVLLGMVPRLAPAHGAPQRFGFGRVPTPEEITAWDIDINPEGVGLPRDQGAVAEGALVFLQKCASCHGPTGTEGPFNVLVGREPLARQERPLTTIGNYWPYATTLYDYINRAMPFSQPGSLTPNEIYGVVAWLLYRNEIIREDQVIDAETLPRVRMPAAGIFVPDPRRPWWVR